jgi:hypothetical protein
VFSSLPAGQIFRAVAEVGLLWRIVRVATDEPWYVRELIEKGI